MKRQLTSPELSLHSLSIRTGTRRSPGMAPLRVLIGPLLVFGTLTAILALPATASQTWVVSPGGPLTIQNALIQAADGDEILLTAGTFSGQGNRGIDFMGRKVWVHSIDGPSACIIDAEGQDRLFSFTGGEDASSVLEGVTLTNGHNGFEGGAIYLSNASPAIRNCHISGNSVGGFPCRGAGVFCAGSLPTFENSFISDNSGGDTHYGADGGGLYADEASSPFLQDCTISANTVTGGVSGYTGLGGGIYCYAGVLVGCTVSGNSSYGVAGLRGGGIYCGPATVANCVVSGNIAYAEGKGI